MTSNSMRDLSTVRMGAGARTRLVGRKAVHRSGA